MSAGTGRLVRTAGGGILACLLVLAAGILFLSPEARAHGGTHAKKLGTYAYTYSVSPTTLQATTGRKDLTMGSNRPGGASWWTRAVHVCTRTSSWLDSLTITSSTGIPASGCSQVLASDTYRGNRDLQVWPNANMVTNRGFVVLVSWLSGGSRVVIHADWVHMLPAAVVPSSGTPSVTEAGSEATFTVALQAPPTAA